jgi:acyl-ACP thioesterase
MPAVLPASELLDPRPGGRIVTRTRVVRLGDVDSRGVLRLDATARYLQDVATDDVADSPHGNTFTWVVRRTMIEVRKPAVVDESVSVTTFCSGIGRCWAERRTSIAGGADGRAGGHGASIEAVSLWVRIDSQSGRPTALNDDFDAVYGSAAGGRKVSSRLRLPSPPSATEMAETAQTSDRRPWFIRRVDIDPLNHDNTAAHWAALEEIMAERRARRRGTAEIEFLAPLDAPTEPGGAADLQVTPTGPDTPAAIQAWLVSAAGTHTALRWQPVS